MSSYPVSFLRVEVSFITAICIAIVVGVTMFRSRATFRNPSPAPTQPPNPPPTADEDSGLPTARISGPRSDSCDFCFHKSLVHEPPRGASRSLRRPSIRHSLRRIRPQRHRVERPINPVPWEWKVVAMGAKEGEGEK